MHFYEAKVCLRDTTGAHPQLHALGYACNQNVQFLCLGQFLGNYKG